MAGERHMTRKCHTCGLEWNVSRLEPGGKKYICPTCEWKQKIKQRQNAKEDKHNGTEHL